MSVNKKVLFIVSATVVLAGALGDSSNLQGVGFQLYPFGQGCVTWGQNNEDATNTLTIALPTQDEMADAFAQDAQGELGSQRLWRKIVDDGLQSAGLEPGTPLHETQRVLRFSNLFNLHGGDVLKPWEDAQKEGRFVDFSRLAPIQEDSFFTARVLSNHWTKAPSGEWRSDWEEKLRNVVNRTLHGGYWSAATSASLNEVNNLSLYTEATDQPVGQILHIPAKNILAAHKNDIYSPMPADFYAPPCGRLPLFETLQEGIASPQEMVRTDAGWNEIYYAPVNSDSGLSAVSTTALFAVTDEKDPNRWSGKHELIYQTARANNLPLVRFSSDS